MDLFSGENLKKKQIELIRRHMAAGFITPDMFVFPEEFYALQGDNPKTDTEILRENIDEEWDW